MDDNRIPSERDPFRAWEPPKPPAPKKMTSAARALIAALVALAITVTGSGAALLADMISYGEPGATSSYSTSSGGTDSPTRPEVNENAPTVTLLEPGAEEAALTEAEIAEKVRPSVVGIVTYSERGDAHYTADEAASSGDPVVYGEGSGVVLTTDGYILTNAHVVEEGDRLLVVDYTGAYYPAEVIGCDTRTDLAVIRVTTDVRLTPAEFGDSDVVQVGDPVLTVGNPGGLSYASSVTYGRVSAVNRVITSSVNVFGLFQVDAAINPGNSGGALVNRWGQVIGINCAKVVASGYEGIGFAIPMTKAKPVFDSLMKYGYVKDRVRLGVTFTPVDVVTAALKNLPQGMKVVSLSDENVFARTDVKAGDIITAIDGIATPDTASFFETLFTYRPNDKAVITLYRPSSGQTFDVTVALLGEE